MTPNLPAWTSLVGGAARSLMISLALIAGQCSPLLAQQPAGGDATSQLDSLERAALNPANLRRLEAAGSIALEPGNPRIDNVSLIRRPGIVARLARIYQQSSDRLMRARIIELVAMQSEKTAAAQFLEGVAREAGPPKREAVHEGYLLIPAHHTPLQLLALGGLETLGADREPALRRLHARSEVTDSRARAYLEEASRRGFRQLPRFR